MLKTHADAGGKRRHFRSWLALIVSGLAAVKLIIFEVFKLVYGSPIGSADGVIVVMCLILGSIAYVNVNSIIRYRRARKLEGESSRTKG